MSAERSAAISSIADAAEWRLLGLLFERPHHEWRREVATVAQEVADAGVRAAARVAQDATEGRYLAMLGPCGAVSPREVTYRSFEDPGRILADITGFYEAFGFHPQAEDPIDHVAVEIGFVGYLLLKEAYARLQGDPRAAEVSATARQRFVETHLSPLAAALAERLNANGADYLAQAAASLAARVPKPTATPPVPPDGDDFSACGGCAFGEESQEDETL